MGNKFLDVTVKIDIVATTGSLGFGYPLILATSQVVEIPYTKCADINEVAGILEEKYVEYNATLGEGDIKLDYTDTGIYRAAQLMFMQKNPPETIAICSSLKSALSTKDENGSIVVDGVLDDKEIIEKDWRQLLCIRGEEDTTTELEIASFIETQQYKMYFETFTDLAVAKEIKDLGYDRTVMYYYDLKDEGGNFVQPYAVAALLGEAAGQEVGSFTYKNLILKGIKALDITSNKLSEIMEVNCITNVEKCGDNVTTEGKCASGEYIDIIDSMDFIISQMEYRVQRLLNKAPKIPYTNSGIASIESEVAGVLNKAYRNGIIADDSDGLPLFWTHFKKREEMSAEDRANRIYTGGKFSFELAGAIHTVKINGEMII